MKKGIDELSVVQIGDVVVGDITEFSDIIMG